MTRSTTHPREGLDGQAGVDFGDVDAYAAPAFTSVMRGAA